MEKIYSDYGCTKVGFCSVCGKVLKPSTTKPKTYCDVACKDKAMNDAKKMKVLKCKYCGDEVSGRGMRNYCNKCRKNRLVTKQRVFTKVIRKDDIELTIIIGDDK